MEIEKALELAQAFKIAIINDYPWDLCQYGGYANRVNYSVPLSANRSKQFMLLLLNTFLEVHSPKAKSPNEEESSAAEKIKKMLAANTKEDEKLQNAHDKYEIPFVRTLQKLTEERSHNFVQQWQDQHDNDDKHLIDFGETKKRTIKIDPAGETPVDDDPEESEEDIPQVIINIGELNINLNGGV